MDKTQTRRLLIVAFAVSLLLHVLLASKFSWSWPQTASETQPIHVTHVQVMRIARVVPSPSPYVPPRPRTTPHAIVVPHVVATGRGPSLPIAQPTPQPVVSAAVATTTPRPQPTKACAGTDTPVAVSAQSTAPPDIAARVRAAATSGTTRIDVGVDANGSVTSTSIASSSGNADLDLVAEALAKSATYVPAAHHCAPIAGTFEYAVRFSPW